MSISAQCQTCVKTLKSIISNVSGSAEPWGLAMYRQVNDQVDRFSLWIGNIGTLQPPESSLSLERRLQDGQDILTYISTLLNDLDEVAQELYETISGQRPGEVVPSDADDVKTKDQCEETELIKEIGDCITLLYRVTSLIRQAAPTDLFAKALSRDRNRFDDRYDIAHVGEKYPKLLETGQTWLQKRLGRAIAQRRHYLSYIQDHRERLEKVFKQEKLIEVQHAESSNTQLHAVTTDVHVDVTSRPSTFFTKASTLAPDRIQPQMLTVQDDADPEDDARSYTTISRSVDGDLDCSNTARIPRLLDLQNGFNDEVECPFCYRIKCFKNERTWQRHVFSDLRAYVCTFPDCDTAYFGDIND